MSVSFFDRVLTGLLWVTFAGFCYLSTIIASAITSPEFEIANTTKTYDYKFDTQDGNIKESKYYIAWYYKRNSFSKPTACVYDPVYKNSRGIKNEYIAEYVSLMTSPSYSWWQSWYWVFVFLLAAGFGAIVYFILGFITDSILYGIVSLKNTFEGYTYFLYDKRFAMRKKAKAQLPRTIGAYIASKKSMIYSKYNEEFATLIMQMLNEIKYQGDTEIKFYYSYEDTTIEPAAYLSNLKSYWVSQLNKDPDAGKLVEYISGLQSKIYTKLDISVTSEDLVETVTAELKNLFSKVMGNEIFNFQAYHATYASARKVKGSIFLKTKVENNTKYFTWSGNSDNYGGIAVRFIIYCYDSTGKEFVLWNRYLDPKCTYTSTNEDFSVRGLYDNMVRETIKSFSESLEKSK